MSWFEFEAKDRLGTVYRDRIEAPDLRRAHHLLAARQWFIIQIKEEGSSSTSNVKKSSGRSLAQKGIFSSKARKKDVPIKTEQMVHLLRAGMRLGEVLGSMARRSTDPAWSAVFEDLRVGVVGGKPLSEAMAAYPKLFGPLFCAMVATGEASGHLVEVLERLAQYLQRREVIQQRLITALYYPAFVILAGISTVVFFMVKMLPALSGMLKEMNKALPWSTQMLISTSNLLIRYGWLLVILFFACWILFRGWMRDARHRLAWDRVSLRWPLVGKLLALGEYNRFTQTLATLLQSGITLVEALQVAEATLGNTALREAIRVARIQVREGKSLNEALAAQGLFPGLMLDMLAVGEKTGDLGGALQHTAQAYERDLDRSISTFTALIEPILIVFMAIFVGGIVLSVLTAVLSLTSGMSASK